ncbi:MAG: hypothetical protein QM572_15250, partial [Nocardioides sp.]|uniref:hypothetical protein n=1 Tax=Nocardioides sp. TaxID=35761 RepID=UPI0039E34D7D
MRTLRARLALAMAGVAVLSAVVAGVLLAPLLRQEGNAAVEDQLARTATVLARLGPALRDSVVVVRQAGRLGVEVGSVSSTGATGVGTALSSEQRAGLLAEGTFTAELRYQGRSVLVAGEVSARGGDAVVVAADADQAGAATRRLRHRVLLAIAIGLLAALLVAAVLAGAVARPLAAVAAGARRLA